MPCRFALVVLAALSLGPAPVRADPAEDYARIYHLLGPLAVARDPDADIAAAEAMIAALAGRWYPLQLLAGGGPEVPEAAMIPKTCALQAVEIAPADLYAFDARLVYRGGEMVTRYQYSGQGLFLAWTPNSQIFHRLYGDNLASLKPVQYMYALRPSIRNGLVTLLMPSPDLLVFLPIGGGAEIWGRCPNP
jgi:hypothetical protein